MNKVKNRGWVKNVAIIFLTVMLILTFFSNTIMNRSLPEVATQAVTSDSITAKIRGTGTVTANGSYEVMADSTRKVKTVMIKEGQEVNTGDILFVLEAGASEELEAARDALRAAQKAYQEALINISVASRCRRPVARLCQRHAGRDAAVRAVHRRKRDDIL